MITISEINIDELKSKDANWYVILLEDNWKDDFRNELYDNVDTLADEVGPKNWVVRGHKNRKDEFFKAIFARYKLDQSHHEIEKFPRPAILITDTVPSADGQEEENFKRILFPLAKQYVKAGTVSDFLKNLAETLRHPDAKEALEGLSEEKFVKSWGWILTCFELKPNFMGVGLNLNALIDHIWESHA